MTLRHIAGAILLALPFVVLWMLITLMSGWKAAAITFGITGFIVAVVLLGAYLLTGN